MTQILQILVDGLGSGAGYVIIALGFSLIFGVAGVLNVAHADFYIVGAYTAYFVLTSLTTNLLLGIATSLVTGVLVGAAYYFVIVRRVGHEQQLAAFVASLGLSMFLQNVIARIAGPDQKPFPSLLPRFTLDLGGVVLPQPQLTLIIAALVLSGLVVGLLRFTPLGHDIRAVAGSSFVAAAMGVNVRRTMLMAVVLSCVVATVGGLVIGNSQSSITPFMGNSLSVKMFIVVLVAGAGSIGGAAIIGFVLGLLESLTIAFVSSSYQDMVGLVALLAVLLVRPAGVFGRATRVG
jgi:branched-chain amino acid transport system permease protein